MQVGGCDPPTQAGLPAVNATGGTGGSGANAGTVACASTPLPTVQAGADGGWSTGVASIDGGTGLAGPTCIVDFNCAPPPSNREEIFLTGDPAVNPNASGWTTSVPLGSYPGDAGPTVNAQLIRPDGFMTGDIPGAEQPTFQENPSAWYSVSVPYTWNALDGVNGPSPRTPYYTGPGWFRKTFTVPQSMQGKRIYIQFDEAEYTTDAYINGMHVGQHQGGYARFRFDITSAVQIGMPNLLAVKVDNSAAVTANNLWKGGSNAEVPPLSGDFTLFGGIERDVRILATDNLAVTPMDYGSSGVYLKATQAGSGGPWTFTATVRLLNMGSAAVNANVEVDILDETNTLFQKFTGSQMVPSAGGDTTKTADAVITGQVTNPHLWGGLGDPYMYHVNVLVSNGAAVPTDGGAATTVTDAIVQPFGFRTYTLDANTGFSLNGKSYPLRGVAMHQDHINQGGQFSFQDAKYLNNIVDDFGYLKELNTDFLRCAHYQHSDFTYSMADYAGIVTWAENAFVNRISQDCVDQGSCQAFVANTVQQYTELIRQNYNHPSIFFWSIGNEVLLKFGPDPYPAMAALSNLGPMEDPTRTTVYASNQGTESADNTENTTYPFIHGPPVWLPQATFFNMYFGWYVGKVDQIGPWADLDHMQHPDHPIGMSEYGAGGEPNLHGLPIVETGSDRTGCGSIVTAGCATVPQTEEYQAFFHEGYWAAIANRPFLTITAIWNVFDFASAFRNEGSTYGENTKGLTTYDRSVKKDAFYFYKANWNDGSKGVEPAPVVYITSRRFQSLPQSATSTYSPPIKVYSNQKGLTATLNGNPLPSPTQDGGPGTNDVYYWNDVKWASGANTVVVTAPNCTPPAGSPNCACMDQVTWTN